MANLATMFPQTDVPFFSGMFQGQQQDVAMQNAMLNQAGALQDLDFDRQNNPLKLQQQQLTNEGLGITNKTNDLDLKFKEFTQDARIQDQLRQYASNMKDDDIKNMERAIQADLYSNDPQRVERGKAMTLLSKAVIAERDKQNVDIEGRMKVQRLQNEGSLAVARENQAGQTARKGMGSGGASGEAAIIAKMGYEKAAVYYDFKAQEALADGDQEAFQRYTAQANKMKIAREQEKLLAAQGRQGGTPDLSGMGVPVMPQVNPQGFTPPNPTGPAPAVAGRPDRQAIAKIPSGAVQMLKQNPNMAAAFDAKYGPGMAALVLGK